MSKPITLTFLGTAGFHATAGYWSSFLIEDRLLVETSPSVLRNLRVAGRSPDDLDVIFISHFHADRTFGWARVCATTWSNAPALSIFARNAPIPGGPTTQRSRVRRSRYDVNSTNGHPNAFKLRYVEVTEQPQEAGSVCFRAVRVDHDPVLDCFGYLIEVNGRTLGYSGDTTLCPGLREIAGGADALVLECNAHHDRSPVHMTFDDVRTIRSEFPRLPIVITHRAHDVDAGGLTNVCVPQDFETVTV